MPALDGSVLIPVIASSTTAFYSANYKTIGFVLGITLFVVLVTFILRLVNPGAELYYDEEEYDEEDY